MHRHFFHSSHTHTHTLHPHQVATAPFFIVEDGAETSVYEHYFQLKKEVLAGDGSGKKSSKADRAKMKAAASAASLF